MGNDGAACADGTCRYDGGVTLVSLEGEEYVDSWYLYGEGGRMVQQGFVEYDDNSANLMDEDGYAYGELILQSINFCIAAG